MSRAGAAAWLARSPAGVGEDIFCDVPADTRVSAGNVLCGTDSTPGSA
jgi:hypothetical protein